MRTIHAALSDVLERRSTERRLGYLCHTDQQAEWSRQWVNQRMWDCGVTRLMALRFELSQTLLYGPRTQPPPTP